MFILSSSDRINCSNVSNVYVLQLFSRDITVLPTIGIPTAQFE